MMRPIGVPYGAKSTPTKFLAPFCHRAAIARKSASCVSNTRPSEVAGMVQMAASLVSATCSRDTRRQTGSARGAGASPRGRETRASSNSRRVRSSTGWRTACHHLGSAGNGQPEAAGAIDLPTRRQTSCTTAMLWPPAPNPVPATSRIRSPRRSRPAASPQAVTRSRRSLVSAQPSIASGVTPQ